jgi:hypothetical protein
VRISHTSTLLAALVIACAGSASAQTQTKDPRIGVWKNAADAGNVMNYTAIPGGGTRLKVDAVNAQGVVTSFWGYDALFDGQWHPVTGTGRSGMEEDALVTLKDPRTTEIRYRRPAGGPLNRILENVVSPNGNTLWVIFTGGGDQHRHLPEGAVR